MREVLFRGKRKDTYEWIEGAYCFDGRKHYILEFTCEQIVNWHEVYAETVGQFTGLCDKNGKRIFEGDLLKVVSMLDDKKFQFCVVGYGCFQPYGSHGIYEMVGFYLYWVSDTEQYQKYPNLDFWLKVREAVCIGNIHENPDFLKGGE